MRKAWYYHSIALTEAEEKLTTKLISKGIGVKKIFLKGLKLLSGGKNANDYIKDSKGK